MERLAAALADRYRIERELGAGGMATVWLAHDLKHGRDVAIKVLHPDLAAVLGPDRFLSEIRTTAKLQHPHILPLLDSGDADGMLYYVMPLVSGETLRARLQRERQLPIDDALRIVREVADALDHAHAHGVVHRDIKPENILLQGAHAMVADFGIALAVQSAGDQRLTQSGMSLGTPQYMSPEQAMGERTLDARSDIWALGAVTYEMLTGEPPFQGTSVQAIVAKTLTERPTPPSTVRDTVSGAMDASVLKALAKLPADRFATAAAFAAALGAAPVAPAVTAMRSTDSGRSRLTGVLVVAAAAVVAAFFAGRAMRTTGNAGEWEFGESTQVTWESGLEIMPAISPDGKQVAYAMGDGTRSRLYIRPVAGGRAVTLTDDSAAVEAHPRWSHDGSRILYLRDGQVFSAPSGGGAPKQEVPARGGDVESATWSPDEKQVAFVIDDSVFVRDASGASRHLTQLFQATLCTWGAHNLIACQAGNRWYLKPGMSFGNLAPSWIAVIDPASGKATGVTDSTGSNVAPWWSADGRSLLFASNRLGRPDIYAVDIGDKGDARGEPRRLTVGLGVNSFSLSADGSRMAYSVLTTSSGVFSQPWPVTSAGIAAPQPLTFGQQTTESLAISHDGIWLYFDSDVSGNTDLYRLRLPNGQPERLTTSRIAEFDAEPSPDGRSLVYHAWVTGSRDIYVMPLDGGPIEQVTRTPEQEQYAAWSPDGNALAFSSQSQPLGVFVARRGAARTWHIRKIVAEGHWAAWSTDGRSLSYVTNLSGGGLRVVPADSGAPRALYDETAPAAPLAETSHWSEDGRTVYFKSHEADGDGSIWSVPAEGGVPRRVLLLGSGRMRSDRYGFRFARGRIYYVLFDRQSNVWVMDVRR